MGYELVRARLQAPGRSTLQVMVERNDRGTMTVDDCAAVSAAVSERLDEVDPIAAEYTLEVSSPGLDRPLTTTQHFRRFTGLEARVELDVPLEGRRRFTGRIVEVVDDTAGPNVVLTAADGEFRLPFRSIRKAKLVMNDELIAAGHRWSEAGRSP